MFCMSLLLVVLLPHMVFALSTTSTSEYFYDTPSHWARIYVQSLHDQCGINGYKSPTGEIMHLFGPDTTVRRAELVFMLQACHPTIEKNAAPYSDLDPAAWYAESIDKAYAQGWISGYKDGTFRPLQEINRAEALKMMIYALGKDIPSTSESNGFSDVHAEDWFAIYVDFAQKRGIVGGKSDGLFHPEALLTRAEAAKIIVLMRQLSSLPEVPMNPVLNMNNNTNAMIPQTLASCTIFPSDNPWNKDVSQSPVHTLSDTYVASMLKGKTKVHPDFGADPTYGIPYVTVDKTQPKVQVTAVMYPDESDQGLAPIPDTAPIESGSDHHVLVFDKDACKLYELYGAKKSTTGWNADSSAFFDLTSNILRPDYWTSADAAGLPIFPGLVRYDEVKSGKITHALRFTASKTQKAFLHPATHYASSSKDSALPPMGLRLRLKSNYDLSAVTGDSKVILQALKTYGMILADNGSDWFITGSTDTRWNDEDLSQMKKVPGDAFEVVDTGETLIK